MESLLGINQDWSQYSEPFFHLISKSKDGLKEQSISSLKKILYKAPNSLEQNEAKEVKDTEIIAKYRVDYFRGNSMQ